MQQSNVDTSQYTILNSFPPHLFLQWPPNIIHARVRLKIEWCSLLSAEKKRVNGINTPGKKYMYLKEEAQATEGRKRNSLIFSLEFFFSLSEQVK